MRCCVLLLLLVAGCVFPAMAEPRPLSVKEVSLMLRAGCSSEQVVAELKARGIIDAPDAATANSLGNFGASAALIAGLTSGVWKVDAAAAERAQAEATDESNRQEKEAERIFRDATVAVRAQHLEAAVAAAKRPPLMESLASKLVACHDGAVAPIDPAGEARKTLIAFYFSAHWCPPCRRFTPQLVDFYNRVAPQHPEFEIVFVSFDRSRGEWEDYLREAQMPWPAIDYAQTEMLTGLKRICGDAIPSLVLLDGTGRILDNSYDNGKYAGPQKVVATLEKIFR